MVKRCNVMVLCITIVFCVTIVSCTAMIFVRCNDIPSVMLKLIRLHSPNLPHMLYSRTGRTVFWFYQKHSMYKNMYHNLVCIKLCMYDVITVKVLTNSYPFTSYMTYVDFSCTSSCLNNICSM